MQVQHNTRAKNSPLSLSFGEEIVMRAVNAHRLLAILAIHLLLSVERFLQIVLLVPPPPPFFP